jgi:hypothetical protein
MVCTIFFEILSMLFTRKSSPTKLPAPVEAASLEVAGGFDAFFSLEDFDPDLGWREALAAAWGVPYTEEE